MSDYRARVLVVEDEPSARLFLVAALHSRGYEVHEAADPQSAMALPVWQEGMDVVISDFRMPGMMGDRFLERVCEAHPAAVRVIWTSATRLEEPREVGVHLVAQGIAHFSLPKPFDLVQLDEVMAQAMERVTRSTEWNR